MDMSLEVSFSKSMKREKTFLSKKGKEKEKKKKREKKKKKTQRQQRSLCSLVRLAPSPLYLFSLGDGTAICREIRWNSQGLGPIGGLGWESGTNSQ